MRRVLGFSFALVMLLSCAAYAQYAGTIRGTVTDPSGAVVSGAEVTVTNAASAITRTATTGTGGEYTVSTLPAGVYSVMVKQGSFKEFVATAVEVHGSSSTIVDAKLTAGAVTESMTVQANSVQVQTDSAQVGAVIDGNQVRELPLNGRSFASLLFLQPGVSPKDGLDTKNKGLLSGVDFSVNGNPVTNNLFLVDGANDNDLGSNRTILIYPSIDSIAEFKMLRNSYGAEYGQASGAVVSILTKSGTNDWHGSGYYFGRNTALNGSEYFAARNHKKDVLRRNDYGYSLGGPIKKDKLFFFWSEEWNRQLSGKTRNSCVPTAAERAGDFSADVAATGPTPAQATINQNNNPGLFKGNCGQNPPKDPADPTKWIGGGSGIIPGALDPAGVLLEDQFPLPTSIPALGTGANNWSKSLGTKLNWRQESARIDYNLTSKHTAMFRYTQDSWTNPAPNAQAYWGDDPYPAVEGSWSQPSKSIVGKVTSVLGSTMTNEVQFSYSNNRINATLSGSGTQGNIDPVTKAAIAELSPAAYVKAINAAIPTNFPASFKKAGAIPPGSGWNPGIGYGGTLWLIAPWNNSSDLYQFRDDLNKVYGAHTVKVGGFFGYSGKNEPGYGGQDQPGFGNNFKAVGNTITGFNTSNNALADLLTPNNTFSSSENSKNLFAHARWHDIEWYIQDNWKIRRNLTVEYGFRWSLLMEPYDPNNQITNWSAALYNPNGVSGDACNGLVTVPGTDPCGASNKLVGSNFSAGTHGKNRALVNNNYHNIAPRVGISWDPWGDGKTAIRAGFGQFFQRERVSTVTALLGQNAPFSVNAGYTRTLDVAPPPATSITGSPSGARDTSAKTPNSWGWNFTVQRELARDTTVELGYVGNRGLHLTSDFDANAPLPGTRLANAFGVGPGRPYGQTGFGGIDEFAHRGTSNYHSLQALFKTRLGNHSELQAAYTWSHAISTVDLSDSSGSGFQTHTTTDPFNPGLDKGNARINRPHIFVANAVFYLPKLSGASAIVRQALGDWQGGTIFTAESGNSVNIYLGGNDLINHVVTGPLPTDFTDVHYSNPSGLSLGTNNAFRPLRTNVSCNSGSLAASNGNPVFFNAAAFTLVGYQFGTAGGRTDGACLGPKRVNADLSLSKNWKLTERVKLQFRLDAFNAFNHANFQSDSINTGLLNNTTVQCAGPGGLCDQTNNVVTSQNAPFGDGKKNFTQFGAGNNGTYGGRELQYSLRFSF